MNATGQRLAAAQLDGHREVDKIFGPLSIAIAAVVMRYATPDQHGILRLTLSARALILNDVGRLLDEARSKLVPVVLASVQAARDAAQEDVEPVPVPITEQMDEMLTVSRALRTDRQSVLDQTGALLLVGIVGKMAASQVAKQVKQYFYKRDPATGLVQFWPGKTNMASQHSRLTMLTETTRAHGKTVRRIAERDNLGLRWRLSPQHQEADACSDNARRDNGWGGGIFLPSQAPAIPQHPRCRCFYETVSLVSR